MLQAGWLNYRWATLLFILVVGGYLARRSRTLLVAVAALAVALSIGLDLLFTHVLIIDLPQ
jgi:hypothetical protein